MSNDQPPKKYDLKDRTAKFGITVINFARGVPENSITRPLISQLVRAGTSVGANYCEADNAESRKDFYHKISIYKKEAQETKHWLRMLAVALPNQQTVAEKISKEAKELNLIFNAITNKLKKSPH